MIEKLGKLTHKNIINQQRIKKTPLVMVILIGFIFLLCVNLVAGFQFDNIKGDLIINKATSEYGKVEIRNSMFGWEWFQLDKLMSLELKENTEQCSAEGCSANQTIIMYEDGKLIDDIRFIDLETGKETSVKSYEIYVNGDLYNGEEVSGYSEGVKYDVELKGKLYPFQSVDWQIKSAGTDWIEDWAVWTDSLNVNLVAYYKLDEIAGTTPQDFTGNYHLISTVSNWTDGLINNGLSFIPPNQTNMAWNETLFKTNQTDFTVSMWFKLDAWFNATSTVSFGLWGAPELSGNNRAYVYFNEVTGALYAAMEGENAGVVILEGTTAHFDAGTWYHTVFRWSKTDGNISLFLNDQTENSTAYVNTYNISAPDFNFTIGTCPYAALAQDSINGTLDEVGIWDRSLSDAEIEVQLYNAGVGISPTDPAVTLNSPIDGYNTTDKNITFNCSAITTLPNGNITNISLYHNETGAWELNQTNDTLSLHNSTSIFYVDFPDYEFIIWNCQACVDDGTCNFGTNRTFTIKRLVVNNETYNENTIEGNTETFIINVTTSGLYISTATMTYNNTEYLGSLIPDGFNYTISVTINVDGILSAANLTFNWTFLMEDATTIYSDNHNQSVLPLTADDCSVNTINILNYTLRDEDNQSKLNGTLYNTEIELDVSIYTRGTLNEIINFSNTYSKVNPALVCLNVNLGNTEYRMDTSTTYTSINRELEHHYLQNFTLTNTTTNQNISLYNLNSSRSTIFLITYRDTNFLPIENALINIQREYLGDGLFRSVEIGKTDADGQTIGHFVQNDVVYTLIISKDGVILATFDNIVAWCDDVLAEDCQINLNQFDTGIPIEDWTSYQNLDYTLSFNKDTRVITLVFVTLDGSSAAVTLNTTKSDRWMNETVCSDKLLSSSGTLTCTIANSYGNVSVISRVYMNDELITQANFKIFPDRDDYFGGTSVILLLILVIILPLMFVTNTIGVVLGSIFGIIIAGALMIYTDFSWLGVRSSIIWLIIAGAILIWKIHERSKT